MTSILRRMLIMKILTPNNLGKNRFMVEDCWKIGIKDILDSYKPRIKEILLASRIELMEIEIDLMTSITNFNGTRYWFKCPICHLRAGNIYKHPLINMIGCRRCLNLDYKKQRYKGMIEEKM